MKTTSVILVLSTLFTYGFTARILVMYATGTKSHKFAVMPIVEELAQRGHQITLISSSRHSKRIENVHEIVLNELVDTNKEMEEVNWFEMQKAGPAQVFKMIGILQGMIASGYDALMNHKEFRDILQQRKVDLVLFDALFNDYVLSICDHLKAPCVMHSSSSGFPALKAMGAPMDYASVPSTANDFDEHMTFFQRMENVISSEMFFLFYHFSVTRMLEEKVGKDFPNTRPIVELEKEASLAFVNIHPATSWVRSLPPHIIPIGALHTRPAKPLPQEFRKFADEAKEGFVVFTLGSAIQLSSMPEETFHAFLNAFAKLPQKVIWKWEAEKPKDVPSNIMMTSWLPQQDLLGHPNARAFITHGGMLGFQEAVFHGVPMLCLPFGNDQKGQARKGETEGIAIKLSWNDLNADVLYDALKSLITDPSFKGNATRLSKLMRDDLVPGLEVATYWIEHVLRHGGTKHLQVNSKDMPFHRRHLLDVVVFLLSLLLLGLFLAYRFFRWVIVRCFHRKSSDKAKTLKQN